MRSLAGGVAADLLSGLGGNDSLTGNEGADTLNGGKGADTLEGNIGNDSYVVDNFADVIVETGGDFRDRILASVSIDLNNAAYAGVESVTLLGAAALTAIGNAGANLLIGNTGANTIDGGAGFDTLAGGAGSDSLAGGGDSDTYIVNSAADKIDESGGGADDRILAAIGIDLNNPAYAGIEHVTLAGTAALTAIGNAGSNMLIGNSGANKLDGGLGVDTLIGAAGNDIYLVDDVNDTVIEYGGEGIDTIISGIDGLTLVLGSYIENVILAPGSSDATGNSLANRIVAGPTTSSDVLNGAGGNDTLAGNNGSDFLDGGIGADRMLGGKGADTYNVNSAGDKIVESGSIAEFDSVISTVTFSLGAKLDSLDLQGGDDIDGSGNALSNVLSGNDGKNLLRGLAGNDSINGSLGDDILLAGDGNDTLDGDVGADTLVGGVGVDTFRFSDKSLTGVDLVADFDWLAGDKLDLTGLIGFPPAGKESILVQTAVVNGSTVIRLDADGFGGASVFKDVAVLQGVSTDLDGLLANGSIAEADTPPTPPINGTAGADGKLGTGVSDLIRGLGANDTLTGDAGFDTLDGGAGNDSMIGGTESDTYFVNSAGDRIDEAGGGTDDRIFTSIAIDLSKAAYAGVEHVTLAGVAALTAIGNAGSNMLIGNAAANKLDGSSGVDTLIGGAGNDIYLVDDVNDLANENLGEGVDTVISTADDFTLGANIENLTLLSAASEGTGNALANKIIGAASGSSLNGAGGNDTLIGGTDSDGLNGSDGADVMVGGKGGDTYFVDTAGDNVVEAGPAGEFDQVGSFITYTLGANLEGLFLFGSGDIDATGNSLNNEIEGGSGNNVLNGLAGNDSIEAGPGKDTLVGGAGSDEFSFTDKNLDGIDVIADFNGLPGGDKLDLSDLVGVIAAGSEAEFIQTAAANGDTTIRLDIDGAGGPEGFKDMAVLQGVSTDLAGLLANGSIANVGTAATPPIDGTGIADSRLGTAVSDLIRGFGGNDTLTGGAGFDTLDGGKGADSLIGGSDSDTYIVDSAADKIDETGGGTDDRILASIAVDLSKVVYAGIEHATLIGAAALSATGNGGSNMLTGNAAANKLDGGAGVDTLIGAAGNDIYLVDDINDLAIENPGAGTETVISSVSDIAGFTLGANIENLTLAAGVFAGSGNALANVINGNADSNSLNGGSGNDTLFGGDGSDQLNGAGGADVMVGGNDSDIYSVNDAGDKVVENSAAGGFDTVNSVITYALSANVEDLWLVIGDNIDGTGNSLANRLNGGKGDNVLSGLGGDDQLVGDLGNDLLLGGLGNDTLTAHGGADTLVGGTGSDRFRFNQALVLDGIETIADFNGLPGGDVLDVASLLVGFTPGVSDVNDFLRSSTANGSTTIQVDRDGTDGGVNFVDMAILQGAGTTIDGLLANGSLMLSF